jgi:replicative DNA helicase
MPQRNNNRARDVFDRPVEDCVIWAIISGNHSSLLVNELAAEDFYDRANQVLFQIAADLVKKNSSGEINEALITSEARQAMVLDSIGGDGWAERYRKQPRIVSPENYIRRLKRLRAIRILRSELIGMAPEKMEISSDPEQAISELMRIAAEASGVIYRPGSNQTVSEYIESEGGIDPILATLAARGIPTGFKKLDQITRGLLPGEMVIIAGRPGMGKSSLVTSILINMAMDKIHVGTLFFSLEMSRAMIMERMVAGASGIPIEKIRHRMLFEEERNKIQDAVSKIASFPLIIDDSGEVSVEQVASSIERAKRKIPLGLVAIDYLQLMAVPKSQKKNRNELLGEVSRSVKAIARNYSVPVVLISQLSRETERRQDKRPHISDLRECGCIGGQSYLFRVRMPPVEIRTLPRGFTAHAMEEETRRPVFSECVKTVATGVRPLYEMVLENGLAIQLTRDHRVMTPTGFLPFGKIRIGDEVIIASNIGHDESEEMELPEKDVEAYGRLFGLGSPVSSSDPGRWMVPEVLFHSRRDAICRFFASASRAQNRDGDSVLIPMLSRKQAAGIVQALTLAGIRFRISPQLLCAEGILNPSQEPFAAMKVAAIDWVGYAAAYDFCCPATENAVVNGIVIHNSLEYDADKIVLMHRPGLYKPDRKDMEGLAEAIVAKHRTGATGTANLMFIRDTSRFVDTD